jgi:biotin carboxylase
MCRDYFKNVGYKNGFANIELWVRNEGKLINIVESNPRIAPVFFKPYKMAYGTDLYQATIELSMGITPERIPA